MKKVLLLLLFVIDLFADPKTCFVKTNQANLFCQTMGHGAPLIILHGGPGLSQNYLLPQMATLSKNHFVVFYDQRGSGRSEGGEDVASITLDVFVDDLEAIRAHFNLKKVSIIGHSWGGFLAMQYAISHPDAIDKLILLNTMPASLEDRALFFQEYLRRMPPYQDKVEQIKKSKEFIVGDSDIVADYFKMIFRTYCALPEKADQLSLRASPQANRNGIKILEIFGSTLFFSPPGFTKQTQHLVFQNADYSRRQRSRSFRDGKKGA